MVGKEDAKGNQDGAILPFVALTFKGVEEN